MAEAVRAANAAATFRWDDPFLVARDMHDVHALVCGRAQTGLQAFF